MNENTAENQPIDDSIAQDMQQNESQSVETEESAPSPVNDQPAQKNDQNAVQTRINKLTAAKYAEQRRADHAEEELNRLKSSSNQEITPQTSQEPKLEDFDYDEQKHNAALIDHRVKSEVSRAFEDTRRTQRESEQVRSRQEIETNHGSREIQYISQQGNETYYQDIQNLPHFQSETLDALMSTDNSPDVTHFLSKHLDVAERLNGMNSVQAALELGKISNQLTIKPPSKKPSNAPDPILPVGSGSTINKSYEDMSMEEIMALP